MRIAYGKGFGQELKFCSECRISYKKRVQSIHIKSKAHLKAIEDKANGIIPVIIKKCYRQVTLSTVPDIVIPIPQHKIKLKSRVIACI